MRPQDVESFLELAYVASISLAKVVANSLGVPRKRHDYAFVNFWATVLDLKHHGFAAVAAGTSIIEVVT